VKLLSVFIAMLAIAAFAIACASDDTATSDDILALPTMNTSPLQGGADLEPSIEITSPMNGATVESGTITVKVDVNDFKLADKIGGADQRGEGHILYMLEPADAPPDALPKVFESAQKEHGWKDVQPGKYTLTVQLANNNGTVIQPNVTDNVTVTVR
jgi:hypothetical protein